MDWLTQTETDLPDLRFSNKFQRLKEVVGSLEEEAWERLVELVHGGEWQASSLYDLILGEDGLTGGLLKSCCCAMKTAENVRKVVRKLCEASNPLLRVSELWEVFSDLRDFPLHFADDETIQEVLDVFERETGTETDRKTLNLCSRVLSELLRMRIDPLKTENALRALYFLEPDLRPELLNLHLSDVNQRVEDYLMGKLTNKGVIAMSTAFLTKDELESASESLVSYLSRLSTNTYLPETVGYRCLALFSDIMQEGISVKNPNKLFIKRIAESVAAEIAQFIVYETVRKSSSHLEPRFVSVLGKLSVLCENSNTIVEKVATLLKNQSQQSRLEQALLFACYWSESLGNRDWTDPTILEVIISALNPLTPIPLRCAVLRLLSTCNIVPADLTFIPTSEAHTDTELKTELESWCLILDKKEGFKCSSDLGKWLRTALGRGWTETPFLSYAKLCSHPIIIAADGCLFQDLLEYVSSQRPELATSAVFGLISTAEKHQNVLNSLSNDILRLCTWTEPDPNPLELLPLCDYSLITPGIQTRLGQERLRHSSFARVFFLSFLESEKTAEAARLGIIKYAIISMQDEEIQHCNSPYSLAYKRKLYLCQLLCVLESSFSQADFDLLTQICETMINSLFSSQVFDLNLYLQRILAASVLIHPEKLCLLLLKHITNQDLRPQAGCGLLLASGQVLLHMIGAEKETLREQLYQAIVPFIISNNAQIRRTAHYILYRLHAEKDLFHLCSSQFQTVFETIDRNKDCVKMRKRLETSIRKFALEEGKESRLMNILSGDYNVFDETYSTLFLKKVVDFRENYRSENRLFSVGRRTVPLEFRKNPVIVIASYMEKLANIAGLTRTCLHFRTQLLTLPNRLLLTLPEFLTHSSGAETSQPLLEVLPRDVSKFLAYHKANGYFLIGLEQTATSVNIHEFKFPRKCVVLLGFEKEGIPSEIIPMLDVCVEIPQFGLIRSLNVHVSAGICLWEYAEQHID